MTRRQKREAPKRTSGRSPTIRVSLNPRIDADIIAALESLPERDRASRVRGLVRVGLAAVASGGVHPAALPIAVPGNIHTRERGFQPPVVTPTVTAMNAAFRSNPILSQLQGEDFSDIGSMSSMED